MGRIKEIIIPAGGENVAPVNIEEEIKSELQEVKSTFTTFSPPISIQTVAFRYALTHEWKEVSEVVFLLLQNNYYQVVSNVMVVGDGRKYLTCLITLKVVNMMMLVKNLLWTIVDVSLKIHHR